jgi:hypothetical protein
MSFLNGLHPQSNFLAVDWPDNMKTTPPSSKGASFDDDDDDNGDIPKANWLTPTRAANLMDWLTETTVFPEFEDSEEDDGVDWMPDPEEEGYEPDSDMDYEKAVGGKSLSMQEKEEVIRSLSLTKKLTAE